MKIIAEKDDLYTNDMFIEYINKNNIIDGVMLQITITSDGKVIIFNTVKNNYNSLSRIQTNTIAELKEQSIVLIDEILKQLKNYTKKIFLELVPFDSIVVTDKNYEQISKFYKAFVSNVLQVIDKYPNLDIYLCSINQSILYHLINSNIKYPIGMIFEPQNLNYLDVNFYIFSYTNFNNTIIEELLDNKKIIMIQVDEGNSASIILEHIKKSNNQNKLREELFVITSSPIIINNYINNKDKAE